jgi:hypothetical protein
MKHPAREAKCTPAQIRAFERIAINQDHGIPLKTLKALAAKKLIKLREETLSGFPPVRIYRANVPLPIHWQWCEWCSEQHTETE